eukprot:31542-Pelagococcus_subviridis.AAC.18
MRSFRGACLFFSWLARHVFKTPAASIFRRFRGVSAASSSTTAPGARSAAVGLPCAHCNGSCVFRNSSRSATHSRRLNMSPNMIAPRHAFDASSRCSAGGGAEVKPTAAISRRYSPSASPPRVVPSIAGVPVRETPPPPASSSSHRHPHRCADDAFARNVASSAALNSHGTGCGSTFDVTASPRATHALVRRVLIEREEIAARAADEYELLPPLRQHGRVFERLARDDRVGRGRRHRGLVHLRGHRILPRREQRADVVWRLRLLLLLRRRRIFERFDRLADEGVVVIVGSHRRNPESTSRERRAADAIPVRVLRRSLCPSDRDRGRRRDRRLARLRRRLERIGFLLLLLYRRPRLSQRLVQNPQRHFPVPELDERLLHVVRHVVLARGAVEAQDVSRMTPRRRGHRPPSRLVRIPRGVKRVLHRLVQRRLLHEPAVDRAITRRDVPARAERPDGQTDRHERRRERAPEGVGQRRQERPSRGEPHELFPPAVELRERDADRRMNERESVHPRARVLELLLEVPPDHVPPHGVVVEQVARGDHGARFRELIPSRPARERRRARLRGYPRIRLEAPRGSRSHLEDAQVGHGR